MKPELSKVIVFARQFEDIEGEYLEPGEIMHWVSMVECGQKVDSTVLSWVIQQARATNANLHYQVDKQDHYIGSPRFHDFVNKSGTHMYQTSNSN